ncbi:hypothetical protein [Marisediminicola sp. LYQ134]|uniref:hypothetical protein n=1 Tax=unclassified Marisediminicola TaxID=2618316 RepID=UPI0039835579
MKSALLVLIGVVLGFAAAHRINKTPAGRAFFADVDATTTAFRDAVVDGYRSREAELRDAVDDIADAAADAADASAPRR